MDSNKKKRCPWKGPNILKAQSLFWLKSSTNSPQNINNSLRKKQNKEVISSHFSNTLYISHSHLWESGEPENWIRITNKES